MSDIEFAILDELYFINTFEELQSSVEADEDALIASLKNLIKKNWVKILLKDTEEELTDLNEFDLIYKQYNYLVTKAGLFAHNSTEQ
ncbi:MAG TPA: transporter [Cytophagaceae bacterium]|jgi:hypothetical protein